MTITTIPGANGTNQTTLQGTDGTDLFTIEESDVYVDGLEGSDTVTINSAVQNITVHAGASDDILDFSAEVLMSSLILSLGSDRLTIQDFSGSIYGGSGLDTITVASNRTIANTLIRGDGGKDDLDLVNLDNTIVNTNADDDRIDITGTTINSSIYGGRQNDVINIRKAVGSLIRGDANDDLIIITDDLTKTIINGNAGDDTFLIRATSITSSTVYGGQGDDVINSNGDSVYIDGGKGNDEIDATGDKKHTIYGGDGEDSINSNSTLELFIDGGAKKDIITLTGIPNTIHSIDGGAGGDIIRATSGVELIDGGTEDDGNDTIISAGGDDTIYGRAGNDLIQLTADGTIRVHAGAGDDIIEVKIEHLSYVDTIKGENGTDTIAIVGDASDYNMWETNTIPEKAFDGISTIEILAFGTQNNRFSVSGTKSINLSSKVQSAGISTIDMSYTSGSNDDVLEINAFQFSAKSNLTFIGSDDKDVNVNFTGGSGNDTITTGKTAEDAADTLTGGLGEDTFNIIATTNDTEITDLGAGGDDTLIIFNVAKGVNATVSGNYTASPSTANHKSTADVVLNAQNDIDIDMSSASGSFGYVINGGTSGSNLQGSDFNDSITGNANSDVIRGGEGADTIVGGAGPDIVNLDESIPAADHYRAEGSSNGANNTDIDNIINGFATANDVFDFADATGAYNGTAARVGFASGALGDIAAATGMQIFSDNITVSENVPTAAEMETYFADGNNADKEVFNAHIDAGVYVAADDGVDTYIMHLASGNAANNLFTAAEDSGTVVAKLNGITDATSLSAANFLDFSG